MNTKTIIHIGLFLVCCWSVLLSHSSDAAAAVFSGECVAPNIVEVYKNGAAVGTVGCPTGTFATANISVVAGDKITFLQYQGGAGVLKTSGSSAGGIDITTVSALHLFAQGSQILYASDLTTAHGGVLGDYYAPNAPSLSLLTDTVIVGSGSVEITGNIVFPGTDDSYLIINPSAYLSVAGTVETTSIRCFGSCDFLGLIQMNTPNATMFELIVSNSTTVKNVTIQNTKTTNVSVLTRISGPISVSGLLKLDGQSASRRLLLNDSTYPLSSITFTGSSTFSSTGYLTVKGSPLSKLTDNSTGITLPLLGTSGAAPFNSIDEVPGTTIGWFNVSIKGRVFTDEGGVPITSGTNIRLVKNGTISYTTNTSNTPLPGSYNFAAIPVAPGDMLAVHINNGTDKGVTVTRSQGILINNLDIYRDDLIIRDDDADPATVITNQNLDTANDGNAQITYLYNNGGGTTLTTPTQFPTYSVTRVYVWPGTVYTPGGTMNLGGDLKIFGTVNAGSFTHILDGSFYRDTGGAYNTTGTTGILRFDNNALQTYTNTNVLNAHVELTKTLDGSNHTRLQLVSPLNIGNRNLTINSASILTTNCNNITAAVSPGVFSNNNILEVCGTETITMTQDNAPSAPNSGIWRYVGSTGAATIKDFGSNDYYKLEILGAASGTQFNLSNSLKVINDFSHKAGILNTLNHSVDIDGSIYLGLANAPTATLSAGSSTINVAENWNKGAAGTLSGTSTVVFDGGIQTIAGSTNTTFYNLTKANAGTLNLGIGSIQFIGGVLSLSGFPGNPLFLNTDNDAPAATFNMMGSSPLYGTISDINVRNNSLLVNWSAQNPPLTQLPGYTANNIVDGGNTSGWFAPASGPATTVALSINPTGPFDVGDTTSVDWILNNSVGLLTDTCQLVSSPVIPGLPTHTYTSEPTPVNSSPGDTYTLTLTAPGTYTLSMNCSSATDSVTFSVAAPPPPPPSRQIPVIRND